MKKVQKESIALTFFMVILFVFSQCDPRGSNEETIEDDSAPYEMMEGEDTPPAEERDTTLDSTEISLMKELQDERIRYKKLLDSIAKVNPNISYTYVPAEEGNIKTVLGDYKVEVDNTLTAEEENTIGVLLQKRFESRQQMLDYYNKLQDVDVAARPTDGFISFYEELRETINYPAEIEEIDTEGLLFVQLAVEKDGSLSNVKVSENINGADKDLEDAIKKAAIEAIKNTDVKWNAALRDGKPVRSKLEIPVWFDPDTTS